jgi:hypothetical protein
MAEIDDAFALTQNVFATDADLVKGSITIGTNKEQYPFAAGALKTMETKGDRTIAYYQIETPQVFNWYLGSSDYAIKEGEAEGVAYTILHKPSHTFNLDLYKDALKRGVQFMKGMFGNNAVPKTLQIVEIHRWQEAKYNFANTIVLSEKEGWVADTAGLAEQAYIVHTIGSGLASLWVQQNVRIANVQGAEMFSTGLPEALGLRFVEQTLGEEAVALLIKKKKEKYGKDRNNEPNTEPALIYADSADYLEANKGAIAIYDLMKTLGYDRFNSVFSQWLTKNQGSLVRFVDLYQTLLDQVPADNKQLLEQRFLTKD